MHHCLRRLRHLHRLWRRHSSSHGPSHRHRHPHCRLHRSSSCRGFGECVLATSNQSSPCCEGNQMVTRLKLGHASLHARNVAPSSPVGRLGALSAGSPVSGTLFSHAVTLVSCAHTWARLSLSMSATYGAVEQYRLRSTLLYRALCLRSRK